MTTTLTHPCPRRVPGAARPRPRASRGARGVRPDARPITGAVLAHYADAEGRPREVFARPGRGGSVLVLDRDAGTLEDRRLVAHLAADEPAENASVVCVHYLGDARGRRCRPLTDEDLLAVPFGEAGADAEPAAVPPPATQLLDGHGCLHRLEVLDGTSGLELRWCRRPCREEPGAHGGAERGEPESVRDAAGHLESYEPLRALTLAALAAHCGDPGHSVAVLRAELARLDGSRIVLNRGLRRAVVHAMRTEGVSLSEIAHRCGRVKRDGRGRSSGETSWLARRVGLAPEGGRGGAPTPWIHTDVLALIARDGLGVSPREVEL
jgi:hypothetical protein